MYASAYDLDPSRVTIDSIPQWEQWAAKDLKMGSRSAPAQALGRALTHRPDLKFDHQALLETYKFDFLVQFCEDRDFDFVKTERVHSIESNKRKEDLGEMMTKLQITVALGGADHPEAQRQAEHYTRTCQQPELKARRST